MQNSTRPTCLRPSGGDEVAGSPFLSPHLRGTLHQKTNQQYNPTSRRFGEDVPPFITVRDNPAVYAGIHAGMLSKAGIDERTQRHLAMAYRLVFNGKISLYDAILQIEEQVPDGPEVQQVVAFLRSSESLIMK